MEFVVIIAILYVISKKCNVNNKNNDYSVYYVFDGPVVICAYILYKANKE